MKRNDLKGNISVIKRMGAEVRIEISEDEIARKLNLSAVQLVDSLHAPRERQDELISQLWVACDDLLKAVLRSNASGPIRDIINLVKDRGSARGMPVSDEEIREKIAIPREQFDRYLNGEVSTPEEVLSLFWSAWPDLLKNSRISSTVLKCKIIDEEELDEDVQ